MIRHVIEERPSPINVMLICACGWTHTESRRQNALARAAKLNAARRSHLMKAEYCTYPNCKCIVGTSTSKPVPDCPLGLPPIPTPKKPKPRKPGMKRGHRVTVTGAGSLDGTYRVGPTVTLSEKRGR